MDLVGGFMERSKIVGFLATQYSNVSLRAQKWALLATNIIVAVVSCIVYRNLVYVILICCLAVVDLLTTVITINKIKNEPTLSIVNIIHGSILFCLLNFLIYGSLCLVDYDVWWIFFIIVTVEVMSVVVAYIVAIRILIPKSIERGTNKMGVAEIAPGAAGFISGTAAMFLFNLYKPSINVAIYIVVSLLCLLICIVGLGLSIQSCRLYLISKYKVSNEEINNAK